MTKQKGCYFAYPVPTLTRKQVRQLLKIWRKMDKRRNK